MRRLVNACVRCLSALTLICLVSTGTASAAQETRSTAPVPVGTETTAPSPGSVTLSPDEVRTQTTINLECEGLADELVLTRRERDIEREGRVDAVDAAKLYKLAAEKLEQAYEKATERGDSYKKAYEGEVRKGKVRTVVVVVVTVVSTLGLAALFGN